MVRGLAGSRITQPALRAVCCAGRRGVGKLDGTRVSVHRLVGLRFFLIQKSFDASTGGGGAVDHAVMVGRAARACFDAVPQSFMEKETDGLHARLDKPDGQRDLPTAAQDKGDGDGYGHVHGGVAEGFKEREFDHAFYLAKESLR